MPGWTLIGDPAQTFLPESHPRPEFPRSSNFRNSEPVDLSNRLLTWTRSLILKPLRMLETAAILGAFKPVRGEYKENNNRPPKRLSMNRFLRLLGLVCVISHWSGASLAGEPCGLKTIKGSYIFYIQGYRDNQPYASSGMLSLNGKGQVAFATTRSTQPVSIPGNGTYTLGADCQGTMSLSSGNHYNLYTGPSGAKFTIVRTSGNDVIAAEANRVTGDLILK